MKRVLVTGGTGFVGANVARRLVAEGHDVHLIVRNPQIGWRLQDIADKVTIHQLDLRDSEGVEALVRTLTPAWIFHLAVYGAYASQDNNKTMVETNVFGSMALIDACAEVGFEAFINTGSSSEYGFKSNPPAETDVLEPNSCYAVTKAAGTHYCQYVARRRNLPIHTLRLYSVYGPFEEPSRLIPTLLVHAMNDSLPPLVNKHIARDYVYVDDVVQAYLTLARASEIRSGDIYNVGTGIQTSLGDLVALTKQMLRVSDEPLWDSMPSRQWDTDKWVADIRHITTALNWTPSRDIEAGLQSTISWLATNRDMRSLYERTCMSGK